MIKFVGPKVSFLQEKVEQKITLDEGAKKFLAEKGYDKTYGAMALNRTINKYLGTLITELKLSSKWDEIKKIEISLNSTKDNLEIKNIT